MGQSKDVILLQSGNLTIQTALTAFEYARFSPREYFREVYSEFTPDKELHFSRRGRGVSFHEFDVFVAPTTELNVISCLHTYVRTHDATERQKLG